MAQTYDVIYVTGNVGLTAGTANSPLFKNISGEGGITVVDANIWSGGAGTITAYIIYTDPTGGTVGGTIANLCAAGAFAAAGTAALLHAGTVIAAAVPPNKTVGVKFAAGTAGTDTCVQIGYVKGV